MIWSTNSSRSANNPVAQLLDSGNFVVKDEDTDEDTESYLWEILLRKGMKKRFRVGPWNGISFSGFPVQNDICDDYARCGPNGVCKINQRPICECLEGFVPRSEREWRVLIWTGGCVRSTPLDCRKRQGFLQIENMKLPDLLDFKLDERLNLEDCRAECLKNCSCTAYSKSNHNGSGCLMWFGELIDIREFVAEQLEQNICPVACFRRTDDSSWRSRRILIIMITSMVGGLLALLLACWFIVWKYMSKREELHSNKEDPELPLFDFVTIASVTNNFSDSNKIGTGGFGLVYKGELFEGQEITVKRLSSNSRQLVKFDWRYEFVDGGILIHGGSQKLSENDPNEARFEWERWLQTKGRQALGVIRLTLSRNVAFNIAKEKITAGLMTALSSMYEKPSASNKVHLMRRLFNLRMTEGASVAQHLNELNTITTQLSSVEIEFDDEVRALILLSSLPDSWNTTVTTVNSSSGNNKLKFDDVRDLVLSEEIRRRESGEASTSSALHTESRGRTSERNSNRGRSKSKREKNQECGRKILPVITGARRVTLKEITEHRKKYQRTGIYQRDRGDSGNFGKVHLADDETLKIVGKGDIRLKLSNQTTWTLKGVRHIPGLKRNLISVGQLDGEGFSTTFSGCEWKITKGALVIARGMKKLLSKGKLSDLKNVDVGLCEDCIFGKQKKVSFAKIGKTPKAEKLELVHTDVWGPSPVSSLAGSLYYVTFIDDSTRKEIRDFCANNGIKMETTVPMTPQQNGVAERMNRTLNERAISMRIHAGLPKFLWVEAINTAAYLINHSAERSKLDAKSNKCAFVGYGGDEFGYRFWDYENRKIIRSKDVIFNENVMYKDSPEVVQEEPGTPELRRSSRIPKPTQRYSPSLHYLLLTDNGEPECYDEAMQVEDSVKWESSMKDEMDSLMSNQTWELAELPLGKKALHNKLVLKIVAAENLHLEQLDVKTAFLHGDLEEEIYMRQPEGFIDADKKNLVCRLKKSLYGLKQALRQWYKKFDSFMSSSGFTRCQADHCCYIKRFDNNFIILLLYVDGMLVAGSDMQEIINLKQKLSKQFAMKDLGAAKQILGMRIKRDTKLSKKQSPKTEEERAHMVKVPYASAIGSLMYAMVCTRPDIAQAVGAVSRRSTTGYVYTLGGTAVSWVSQLQKIVALSTTEAEYVAVTEASKEMVWLQSFLEETKHIQLRYHFIRSLLEDEILKLEKISGAQNPADMLTKTVTTDKLKLCSTSVGMLDKRFVAVRRRKHNLLNSVINFGNSRQGVEQFKNEIARISKLQHRNLVRLLGCCIKRDERIFIYEFMPNRSLNYFIFDETRRKVLKWPKLFKIIMGISRGLLYLHQDSRLRIIHRDLKASNVLLDNELNPKISDFGIAKTKRVVGTYGYMSSEYTIDGKFSVKSDVFSLGVLLLEIVSGKRNRGFNHPDHYHNLLGHAWLLWNDKKTMELMDRCSEDSCVEEQVVRCIQVGLLCVQKHVEDRPTMSCVVRMLDNEEIVTSLPRPKEPGFYVERSSGDTNPVGSYYASAVNTLAPAQSLRNGSTLVSPGQIFELGFFSPVNSNKYYLGICTGNLFIFDGQNTTIWSTNSSRSAKNPIAQLLDSGNLVVKDEDTGEDTESYLWESFDCPSDTQLEGIKIERNFKTGINRYLTAWKGVNDPSPGEFTYGLDNDAPKLVVREGTKKRFRMGPWNGIKFGGHPSQKSHIINHVTVFNTEGAYDMYEVTAKSVISRITVNESGLVQRLVLYENTSEWTVMYTLQNDLCNDYARCGPNGICKINQRPICECLEGFVPRLEREWQVLNWTGGCVRRTPLDCQERGGFLKIKNVKLPDLLEFKLDERMNLKDCRIECLKNCSCTAYANSNYNGSGCLMWFGNLIDIREFIEEQREQDIYIRVTASEIRTGDSIWKSRRIIIIVASSMLFGLIALALACWYMIWKYRRKRKESQANKEDMELPLFDFATIASATNNFCDSNKIGTGRFGLVYKGELFKGQEIAVRGFLETPSKDSRLRIVHRDLKASNVLLDNELNPKISDFGIAKMFGGDQVEARTKRVIGTYGYMSPEYAIDGKFSVKSDVFSLGGPSARDCEWEKEQGLQPSGSLPQSLGTCSHLSCIAWLLWNDGKALELMDRCLEDSCVEAQVVRCIQVGLLCVQKHREDRPTMSYVVRMLDNEEIPMTLPQPKEPGFYVERSSGDTNAVVKGEKRVASGLKMNTFVPRSPALVEDHDRYTNLLTIAIGLSKCSYYASAADTLAPTQSIRNGSTLVLPPPKEPGFYAERSSADTNAVGFHMEPSTEHAVTLTLEEGR
ncbi:Receptor-like serine/threonine-protein kinase SD1-8 [Hibiscus syriacus]|uniref:non-specific serine/threonine protein kinase n=1 Tax=Hibiscus syriacus TaxID=106335 RepID=A0A6A2ZL67_HIBSY|nr:Receptor-like serine/threonine-protein kinase SD1-8 [Hibiscus syriacus]